MFVVILSLTAVCMLVLLSVHIRVVRIVQRHTQSAVVMDSPVSEAIKQLIGTAGGIYLALVMVADFIKLDVVDKLYLYNWGFDPIALFAIAVAVIQPFVCKMIIK